LLALFSVWFCAENVGSDLDGDQYFVSWDQALIPRQVVPPYSYPSSKEKSLPVVTQNDIIDSFCRYNVSLVGKIDFAFNYWADRKGMASIECEQLNTLFSRAIDSAKTGENVRLLDTLKPPPREELEKEIVEEKFIWQKLITAALEKRKALVEKMMHTNQLHVFTKEMLLLLLAEERLATASDYERFRFVVAWTKTREYGKSENRENSLLELEEWIDFVDFAKFTFMQKLEAIEFGVPAAIVHNALNRTHILSKEQLALFKLDGIDQKWRLFERCENDETIVKKLAAVLGHFSRKLIVFRMQDHTRIAVFVRKKLDLIGNAENIVDDNCVVYFYGPSSSIWYKYCVTPTMRQVPYSLRVDLKKERIDLYQGIFFFSEFIFLLSVLYGFF
jgi:hypothetical protein